MKKRCLEATYWLQNLTIMFNTFPFLRASYCGQKYFHRVLFTLVPTLILWMKSFPDSWPKANETYLEVLSHDTTYYR